MANEEFTHLVAVSPNRGEKFLMAISCGRFVIHPDYITKCYDAGRFLPEDEFEYGNPKFLATLKKPGKFEECLHYSPYKWRRWIHHEYPERFGQGAFTGLKFICPNKTEKLCQFTNVTKSGGGEHQVIDFSSTLKPALIKRLNIDVCFIEKANDLSKTNNDILQQCNVKIIPLKQVNQYLMSPEAPNSWKTV